MKKKTLADALILLMTIADEIIVIDSYSADNTEKIALDKGAVFIKNKFVDYVSQHEFADQQSSNDYILSLDADEVVSEDLAKSIQSVKKYWNHDGYSMNRMTNYCGKWIPSFRMVPRYQTPSI